MSRDYRELDVWQLAMRVAESAYVLTERFNDPRHRDLAGQIRHVAVRVPSNIADAHAHGGERRRVHRLARALSRLAELDTLLTLAGGLGVVERKRFNALGALCAELADSLGDIHDRLQRRAALSGFPERRPESGRRPH